MNWETTNFIHQIIEEESAPGGRVYGQQIVTRFPPEPNGFLHIGHAKAINMDFGTALKYGGICNLRMDDTNPVKEDTVFVESIQEDIHWLGFDWGDRFYFASDYFERMFEAAIVLIKKGLAYVDDLSAEEMRAYRGTLTEPGKPSPWRDRSVDENLDLFQRMRDGAFADGEKTLRAKIDLASGNINMRDPVIYRIAHQHHHRQGDKWCIYPMYDFAHPIEDAIEGITHSLCSLEFENHRPLYDWVVGNTDMPHKPRQIEFARLNLTHTVMSKRKLRTLVEKGLVDGWDDPRLPTIQGLRRRGFTPQSIRNFCERIGMTKTDSMVDARFLDYCVREDLNEHAPRAMAVLDPIMLVIDNYPEDKTDICTIANHPKDPSMGTHTIPFGKKIWIEREDFMIQPPKKYYRLFPGNEVRLQNAYIVKATDYELDENGNVKVVHATYDPESFGGTAPDGRKIRGTIHWVPVNEGVTAEVRLYDRLFTVENPDGEDADYQELLNPESLTILSNAVVEPWLAEKHEDSIRYQFMRKGYFCEDRHYSTPEKHIYNRVVTLRDSFNPESEPTQH
ncbi:glutamine--tRNA ligase/YqeY domain fusion protein [Murdochiella vaginalis]|uniref:glutamine--tRNA ligase/YqeY domain fusion protein n=1 Tax=Murdochiella vaginalis TaxID=1852373 RepID=UPI0008FDC437|nr:glutamine--tRNA ligase/YqeY domain fusion protein [Murdochiella vaginalis]